MELLKAILGRRSIRKYQKKKVEHEKIIEILKAATWAPSARNVQSWRFIVIKDKLRTGILKACRNQSQVQEASHIIVVCFDKDIAYRAYGKWGETLYAIQDTAVATQNMILRAYELGLGTCWIGAFDGKELAKLLKMPKNIKPVAVVTVGYPDESPESQRKDVEEVTLFMD